jgi:hypothetical protein
VRDPAREAYNIYIHVGTDNDGNRFYLTQDPDGRLKNERIHPNAEAPLYMRIPNHVADAIAEELRPLPEASGRHLNDAIVVRDRLLTMVELNQAKENHGG